MRRSIGVAVTVALLAGCSTLQMTGNLQKELEVSRQGITTEGVAKVVRAGSPGPGSGSGSVDGAIVCTLLLLVALSGWRKRRLTSKA
jgi:hypothetical protein